MRFHARRSVVTAFAAAMTLTSLNLAPAQAAAPKASAQSQLSQSTATTTDFSARRRHYRRGNAAALGAVIGVFGAIASIAAADRYRDRYYYGDPYYGSYYGGPYYGAPYAYGPVYRYGYGRHHRHRR